MEHKIYEGIHGPELFPSITTYRSNKHFILVLVEDSVTGLNWYREVISKAYKDIHFYIDTTNGFGNIFKKLCDYTVPEISSTGVNNRLITDYILIYDSGADRNTLRDIRRKLRRFNKIYPDKAAKIKVVNPLCTEEVLLSFTYAEYAAKIRKDCKYYDLYKWLMQLVKGEREDKDKFVAELIERTCTTSAESAFEVLIYEVFLNTQYKYSHEPSRISDCWFNDCNDCSLAYKNDCNKYEGHSLIGSKVLGIAHSSFTVNLLNTIDSILGFRYRDYICDNYIPDGYRVSKNNRIAYINNLEDI